MKIIHKYAFIFFLSLVFILNTHLTQSYATNPPIYSNKHIKTSAYDVTQVHQTKEEWQRQLGALLEEKQDELTASLVCVFPPIEKKKSVETRVYFLPKEGPLSYGVSILLKGSLPSEVASFKERLSGFIVDSGDLYATAVTRDNEGKELISVITTSQGSPILWYLDPLLHCRFAATGDIPPLPQKNARKGYAA